MHYKYGKTLKTATRRKKQKLAKSRGAIFQAQAGYNPELLYVECGRCGAPVLWEPGKATELLSQAGVDPVELDASCILITDACPACGTSHEFTVRIFRISDKPTELSSHPFGHA